ncbi:MAG: hypothetical protein KGM95_07315 [Betaproteobacteria bacterium]|nr:hypothetical protein [Betaproteobacteria bacterium]
MILLFSPLGSAFNQAFAAGVPVLFFYPFNLFRSRLTHQFELCGRGGPIPAKMAWLMNLLRIQDRLPEVCYKYQIRRDWPSAGSTVALYGKNRLRFKANYPESARNLHCSELIVRGEGQES